MYQDSKRTCTAIVLLIKPFVWCRSRRRRRRGLLKLPNIYEIHVSAGFPEIVLPAFRLSRLHLSNPERLLRKYFQRYLVTRIIIVRPLTY